MNCGRLHRLLLNSIAVLLTPFVVHAGPNKGAGSSAFPNVPLAQVARGAKAIEALGAHLPDVARAYGLTAEQLQTLFRTDDTLSADLHGRLHYVEPVLATEAATATTGQVAAATIPLADTFTLHSRPGAKRMIYLDFNGHVLSGTGWNNSYNGGKDIIAPPWDIDGDPTTFNDEERTRIQEIWKRVAEDYAPFDVDVTTELLDESQLTRSSTSDEYYGTRVLISPISQYFGNYGGIAYVGSFDDVGDTYKPALVFPENLGPNGAKYIAEAASHEAGHNLGLSHDGTSTAGYYTGQGSGEVGWAPIMGAGYYENVTQWSKGEYADANNTQDDLAVMQTYGLPYRPDDHGNTAATASYFPSGTQLAANGIIEQQTDVDVFAFTTAAGPITITVSPTDVGPNLDIAAELRDANGVLVAASNPVDHLAASFSLSVAAGTYFLFVRGSGCGDPLTTGYTAYASIGQYTIAGTIVNATGTVAPVANATATVTPGSLTVQFSGAGSFDQDGTISTYSWNFGDGTTGSGVNVSHTYAAAGTYAVTLTVVDNTGLTGTATTSVQVTQTPTTGTVHVGSITLTKDRQNSGTALRATIVVVDASGARVPGVTVNGSFNSVLSGTATGLTDSNGTAVLASRRAKKNGTVTFTVTGLSKSGYTYDATQNAQTSVTITVP